MTVAELIAKLLEHDQDRVVYVGTDTEIGQAAIVEDDCFELAVGPAVLIECAEDGSGSLGKGE